MSGNYYSEIYLHITWRTKESIPFITREIEGALYEFIKQRCRQTPGLRCYALGGTGNHLHLCVSVPPTLLISDWIGDLKGASSHYINHQVKPKSLQWQTGYGVVSFGKNNLKFVKEYVDRQKERHSEGKIFRRLEYIQSESDRGKD